MAARLFCRHGPFKGMDFELTDEATIGRGADNQIVLDASSVSTRHARVFRDQKRDCYRVEDLDSLNGTELDGEPLVRIERLGVLSVLSFGSSGEFIFHDDSSGERRVEPAVEDSVAHAKVSPPVQAGFKGIDETASDERPAQIPEGLLEPDFEDKTHHDEGPLQVPERFGAPDLSTEPGPGASTSSSGSPALPGLDPRRSLDRSELDSGGQVRPLKGSSGSPALPGLDPRRSLDRPELDPGGQVRPLKGSRQPVFSLEVVAAEEGSEGGEPECFELVQGEQIVGRGSECEVRLILEQLSRRHCRLRVVSDLVLVRDLGSTNGTFVDGHRLKGDEEVPLEPGVELRLGDVRARLVSSGLA